jgi:hypothetical protein
MTNIVPSQVVAAIDSLFGAGRNELDVLRIGFVNRNNVRTILWLLDELPRELLTLPFAEYTQYLQSRAALSSALALWDFGGDAVKADNAGGADPVMRIRRLLVTCVDEFPPSHPDFGFVTDTALRAAITEDGRAAWVNFQAREWKGAAVFAGAAIEALLLWGLKERLEPQDDAANLEKLDLSKFIDRAKALNLLTDRTASQLRLAKNARNLIHPGRVAQEGMACDRGGAMAALAGLEWAATDLRQRI